MFHLKVFSNSFVCWDGDIIVSFYPHSQVQLAYHCRDLSKSEFYNIPNFNSLISWCVVGLFIVIGLTLYYDLNFMIILSKIILDLIIC